MGTNYYVEYNQCEHCGRNDRRHIGKSSAGWAFSLRVYPDEGINTFDDWKPIFFAGSIVDEYGNDVPAGQMIHKITNRSWPKGLRRSKVDGWHCVGHGEGTWDYIQGDFS